MPEIIDLDELLSALLALRPNELSWFIYYRLPGELVERPLRSDRGSRQRLGKPGGKDLPRGQVFIARPRRSADCRSSRKRTAKGSCRRVVDRSKLSSRCQQRRGSGVARLSVPVS